MGTSKTAVVTGAASGIGRALATQLAQEGHHVHLADVSSTQDLAAAIGAVPHSVDVGDANDMTRLAEIAPDARVIA